MVRKGFKGILIVFLFIIIGWMVGNMVQAGAQGGVTITGVVMAIDGEGPNRGDWLEPELRLTKGRLPLRGLKVTVNGTVIPETSAGKYYGDVSNFSARPGTRKTTQGTTIRRRRPLWRRIASMAVDGDMQRSAPGRGAVRPWPDEAPDHRYSGLAGGRRTEPIGEVEHGVDAAAS